MAMSVGDDWDDGSYPLDMLVQLVSLLNEHVDPLRTVFMEQHALAEQRWREARCRAHALLPELMSLGRRWCQQCLQSDFRLRAEDDLSAVEEAISQFMACPVPHPELPIGWHEDPDGRMHTPVGGSTERHRRVCDQMIAASAVATVAVRRLTRYRDWAEPDLPPAEGRGSDKKSAPGAKKRDKASTQNGDARAKFIAALTQHHGYANGTCENWVAIKNNALARLAGIVNSTASRLFCKVFADGKKREGLPAYKRACRDKSLARVLKLLNNEYSPHLLLREDSRRTNTDGDG
jgi:hypothetical protein